MKRARAGAVTILLFACIGGLPAYGEDNFAGSAKVVSGSVLVIRGNQTLACKEGMRLFIDDALRTEKDGAVGIMLHDGTRVSLGPNSEIKIAAFLYEPSAGKFGLLLNLLRGAMAYVSGAIGRYAPQSVRVETPVGFIGMRGTHFAVSLGAAK